MTELLSTCLWIHKQKCTHFDTFTIKISQMYVCIVGK